MHVLLTRNRFLQWLGMLFILGFGALRRYVKSVRSHSEHPSQNDAC